MGNRSEGLALALMLVMAISTASLLMVIPAKAQTIPTPSVPSFTLQFVDNSYNVPTTTSIDPYTGQTITHQGYHVTNITLVMTIQNQPLVYQYNGSQYAELYYNIQAKGHYAENWSQIYANSDQPLANASSPQTMIIVGVLGDNGFTVPPNSNLIVSSNGTVDFQVQAMLGFFYKKAVSGSGWFFQGNTSDWSPTQTITIPANSVSPSPSLTSTPAVPELSWLVIVPLLLSVISVAVIIRHRSVKHG